MIEKLYKNIHQNENINDTYNRLEDRLFMVYVLFEMIWLPIIAVVSFAVKLNTTALFFTSFFIFDILVVLYERIFKSITIPKVIYLLVMVVKVPILWYFVGGNASSASAMFLLEIIFFAMVNKGIKQIIFILISIISSGMVSNLSNRFPDRFGGLEMNGMQHAVMSPVLGTSITIFVALLIYYQKKEYNKENRLAMERDEQLQLSNKMQKNFLANMSHEIRSPLGIVLGFNDLIRKTSDIDTIYEYSSNIKSAGKMLQTVINDILDYSKIEAGKLDIIESDYKLNTMIKELERDIKLRCDEKGLRFIVEREGELPEYLCGDVIRLKQCVFNILTNAVKYTKEGFVKFTIKSEGKAEDGGNKLVFVVEDSGRGISEDLLPQLFSSFQRLNEGQNRGIEGTGLGLAITKSLVDQMKGTIDVHSEVGKGSIFTIHIAQKDGTADEKEDTEGIVDVSVLKGIEVLAVDDVEMNLVIIETILKSENMNVTIVNSGKLAIEKCKEKKFDIILMDHMMPEMDGIKTYKNISADSLNKETPVIMLTANAMMGAKEEYMSAGLSGYVTKPINQNELIKEMVRVYL